MSKQDSLKFTGQVVDANRNSIYKVVADNGAELTCTLSGKMRLNNIRVMVGDTVEFECSPYDLTKGRICKRL